MAGDLARIIHPGDAGSEVHEVVTARRHTLYAAKFSQLIGEELVFCAEVRRDMDIDEVLMVVAQGPALDLVDLMPYDDRGDDE